MHKARAGNGYAPNPIDFAAINAWQLAMDYRLRPWEVEAIRFIDDTYLAVEAEMEEKRSKKGAPA